MSDSAALIQNGMNYVDDYIAHYGKGHLDGGHSGRYPWGSGKNKDTNSPEYKQKAYTNGHGRLSKAGKERYGFDDAAKSLRKFIEHPKSGGQLTDYDFTWYRAKGLDGFKDAYRTTLEKNPDLKKSLDELVDYFNKIEKDGVKLDVYSAFEQLEERVNQWYMQELFGIKHSAIDYVDDYIAHYGRSKLDGAPIGSGRFHLGSGEDPYQDYPNKQAAKAAAKEARVQKKEQKQTAKKEKMQKELEDKKFKLLRKGDIEAIIKNQEIFTNEEIRDALARSKNLKGLKELAPKKKGITDRIDDLSNLAGKATKWINTGANLYSAIKGVYDLKDKGTQATIEKGKKIAEETIKGTKQEKQPKQSNQGQSEQKTNQSATNNNTTTHPETGRVTEKQETKPIFREEQTYRTVTDNKYDPTRLAQMRYQTDNGWYEQMTPAQIAQQEYLRRHGYY